MFESKEEYAAFHFAAIKKYIEELEHDETCRNDLDRMNRLVRWMVSFEESCKSLPYECEIS